MSVTPQEIQEAVILANPEYRVVLDDKNPYLVTVYPPTTYTTEFEVEAWLEDDAVELWCNAGYDPRILPLDSTATQVADGLIGFIEENESYAKDS